MVFPPDPEESDLEYADTLTEKQLLEKKLTKASEAVEARALPSLPGGVKQTVKLSELRDRFHSFLGSSG